MSACTKAKVAALLTDRLIDILLFSFLEARRRDGAIRSGAGMPGVGHVRRFVVPLLGRTLRTPDLPSNLETRPRGRRMFASARNHVAPLRDPEAPECVVEAAARDPEARARLLEAPARDPEARARLLEAPARDPEARARLLEAPARDPEARARLLEAPARDPEARARLLEAPARDPHAAARDRRAAACDPHAAARDPPPP